MEKTYKKYIKSNTLVTHGFLYCSEDRGILHFFIIEMGGQMQGRI